jgi:hypothetical protein
MQDMSGMSGMSLFPRRGMEKKYARHERYVRLVPLSSKGRGTRNICTPLRGAGGEDGAEGKEFRDVPVEVLAK